PDAVALNRQHLDQYLVAFFEFVADIFDAVLSDFADMQQTVRDGDDLDERAEISQTSHFAEIGDPHFGGRSEVADDLQGLVGGNTAVRVDLDYASVCCITFHAV